MHTCMLFNKWILTDRISIIRELRFCMNCLRKGHRAEKCRAPPMCKKCTNHHHTLPYWDDNYLSEKKPGKEEGKEDTHVESLSVIE